MTLKQATVKAPVTGDVQKQRASSPSVAPATRRLEGSTSERAEAIRRALADAWGQMGAAWGVAPAIARVHGYLLAHQAPLTEREVREALGLSHRAASLALAESEAWGLVERVPEPRRVGRRGPPGVAFKAVGDHWQWFIRIVEQRKLREGDPVLVVIADAAEEARQAVAEHPADVELVALRDWLTSFHDFVRLFDRSIGIVPQLDPRQLERALRLIGRIPDETALRLVRLLVEIPDADVLPLLETMSRLSPAGARRATKLIAGVVRTVGR
jgi:DNA-binding transcriptional regulator GbsR (MarR family)